MTIDIKKKPYISREQLTVIFISSYYDLPLEGLAVYKIENTEEIIRFDCSQTFGGKDDNIIYKIERLSEQELIYELSVKKEFEECVGTHWSYDPQTGKPLPPDEDFSSPEKSKTYFERQKQRRRPAFPSSRLIGWTDRIR